MNIYLDAIKLNYCIISIGYRISHVILYHPICLLCIFIVFDSYVNRCLYGTIKYFVLYCIVFKDNYYLGGGVILFWTYPYLWCIMVYLWYGGGG